MRTLLKIVVAVALFITVILSMYAWDRIISSAALEQIRKNVKSECLIIKDR